MGGIDGTGNVLRSLGPEDQDLEARIHGSRVPSHLLQLPFAFLWAMAKPLQAVLREFPKLDVRPIGEFNHWDRRECKVQNCQEWKECASAR